MVKMALNRSRVEVGTAHSIDFRRTVTVTQADILSMVVLHNAGT